MAAEDFSTPCGVVPVSIVQMLAACIVGYHDIAGIMHYRLNVLEVTGDCDDLHDLVDCNTNAIEPERLLVENIFALDECGRIAIKIFNNSGEGGPQ